MEAYKEDFVHFMIESQVLKFGDFVTKSGRNTPFFINAGNFSTGKQLSLLGRFYARSIMDGFKEEIKEGFDLLFGPAYKGIPLACAAAIALTEYGINVKYAANRKETKDHGEGGKLLGGPIEPGDRVLIIEDVTTAGTSIRETYPIINKSGNVKVFGLVVCVDRMERGTGNIYAMEEIERDFALKVNSIVNMEEIVSVLYNRPFNGKAIIDEEIKMKIDEYYKMYGV